MNALYPIFLKLAGRLCLVVGGGAVAYRKAESLSSCGATLRIVAQKISDETRTRFGNTDEIIEREYQPADLDGCILAIAATDNPSVNTQVARDCRVHGILVNSVDDPDNCDFYVPAVVRKGDIQIAISSGGASPALSGWIRREIENLLTDRLAQGMEIIACVRKKMIEADPLGFEKRARVFSDFFETELWRGYLEGSCELSIEGVAEWISSCSDSAM
jgi:precorrin-2 dehydrogenase / sirohydrochlorin ferrochelatase